MSRPKLNPLREVLRMCALGHPETQEGIACAGTALEKIKITVKGGTKAFVFLGLGDVMVKLRASLPEANQLATQQPDRFKVGAHGWTTAKFAADQPAPPRELLTRWIGESYRLVVSGESAAGKATPKSATRPKSKAPPRPRSKRA